MTGPSCSAMIRRVASASSASEVKGFCTAVTWKPRDSRIGIVFAQLLPSANAPWTSAIFFTVSCGGFVRLAPPRAARTAEIPAGIVVFIFIRISLLRVVLSSDRDTSRVQLLAAIVRSSNAGYLALQRQNVELFVGRDHPVAAALCHVGSPQTNLVGSPVGKSAPMVTLCQVSK